MSKVISLFTGAGGLDLGLEKAGFTTAVAVEFDSYSCQTLRQNVTEERQWKVIERDIHGVPSDEILREGNLAVGETDLLAGGPPCQPFSKSGYWALGDTKRLSDPRADTLSAYLRVLRDIQPRVFLLENVFGLAYKGKNEGMVLLQETIEKINSEVGTNYSFEFEVLNCANYGVPQVRERVFVVGCRDGRKFKFPRPTHYDPQDEIQLPLLSQGRTRLPWTTVWDAIGELENTGTEAERATGKWADLLPSIPEGQNYLYHTDRGGGVPLFGWRRRYWSFLLKLAKDRPSWTVQAQPGSAIGPFHWKSRRLTVPELMGIQTFPKDYRIFGGRTEVQRQLGNAVPSLMAEVLGREIRTQFLDAPLQDSKLNLLPLSRTPIPKPEELRPVPDKYFHLVGDHEPHPGTGKGHLVKGLSG